MSELVSHNQPAGSFLVQCLHWHPLLGTTTKVEGTAQCTYTTGTGLVCMCILFGCTSLESPGPELSHCLTLAMRVRASTRDRLVPLYHCPTLPLVCASVRERSNLWLLLFTEPNIPWSSNLEALLLTLRHTNDEDKFSAPLESLGSIWSYDYDPLPHLMSKPLSLIHVSALPAPHWIDELEVACHLCVNEAPLTSEGSLWTF